MQRSQFGHKILGREVLWEGRERERGEVILPQFTRIEIFFFTTSRLTSEAIFK